MPNRHRHSGVVYKLKQWTPKSFVKNSSLRAFIHCTNIHWRAFDYLSTSDLYHKISKTTHSVHVCKHKTQWRIMGGMEKKYEMCTELKFTFCLPRPIKLTFKITCIAFTMTTLPNQSFPTWNTLIPPMCHVFIDFTECRSYQYRRRLREQKKIDSHRKLVTHTDRPEYQVKLNAFIFTLLTRKSIYAKKKRRAFHFSFFLSFTYPFSYSFQDYHVFFMHNPAPTRCLIFDLDTTLPFPTYFHKYVTETFRSDLALRPEHHR